MTVGDNQLPLPAGSMIATVKFKPHRRYRGSRVWPGLGNRRDEVDDTRIPSKIGRLVIVPNVSPSALRESVYTCLLGQMRLILGRRATVIDIGPGLVQCLFPLTASDHCPTAYLSPDPRRKECTSSTRRQTIHPTLPRSLFSTVSLSLAIAATPVPYHSPPPHPPDDAFAAKHIPHLGHAVKESKVFHWRAEGWKKLDKKLTSPEFSCGGHKWCVSSDYQRPSHLRNLKTRLGG